MTVLDPGWFSDCAMERIVVHWTAGTYDISSNDRSHYHFLVDKDGGGHCGDNPVSGNARENPSGPVTSHCKNFNTGSIGISVAAMGEAVENPFETGPWPITKVQFRALAIACAQLCHAYAIPTASETLLMHGEVEDNCGVKQDGKWDIGRLPFAPDALHGCGEVGDFLRTIVQNIIDSGEAPVLPKRPEGATVYIHVEAPPGVNIIVTQETV